MPGPQVVQEPLGQAMCLSRVSKALLAFPPQPHLSTLDTHSHSQASLGERPLFLHLPNSRGALLDRLRT